MIITAMPPVKASNMKNTKKAPQALFKPAAHNAKCLEETFNSIYAFFQKTGELLSIVYLAMQENNVSGLGYFKGSYKKLQQRLGSGVY